MQFTELTVKEYNDFMMTTPYMSHYFQVKENIDNREKEGYPVVLLGVKENDRVIAASLFSKIPSYGSYIYYSNRGPVLDIHHRELIDFYFSNLDSYLKRHQALSVKVDPYWVYRKYDKDVNYKEEEGSHDELIEWMTALGYTHGGFTRGYTDTQVRWMSVLYLDGETPESLMKHFDSQRKRNIKKAEKFGVKVRYLKPDEIDRFLKLYRETEERTGFIARDDDYFRNFANNYGNKVIMPLAYIDLEEYIETLTKEQQTLMQRLEQMESRPQPSDKQLKKVEETKQLVSNLNKNIHEAQQLMTTDGKVLDLAAGMFFENNFEVNYFSGGSSNRYSQFMGPYAMHWHMINYSLNHKFSRYNFYGVSGEFDESGEDYGVYRFKRGFNAQIEELVGDFTKTINPSKQWLVKAADKAKRQVKKVVRK